MSHRKLSDEQVATIRTLYANGRSSYRLGAEYGVSKTVIANIVNGAAYTREPSSRNAHRAPETARTPTLYLEPPQNPAWLQASRLRGDIARELYQQEKQRRANRPDPRMAAARRALEALDAQAVVQQRGGRPKGSRKSA